ncbi:hypothetical protein [Pseudoduganella sp. RAF53_2]|uniref:hypothetical protein n=1 Tax=unclassified Pseudoduganella TaxID=2637179 RepID=UPI003F979C74
MKTTLVLFLLGIKSSYINDEESEATEEQFDTIQFVQNEKGAWRVKTFAEDEDVHLWSIAAEGDLVELAVESTNKHYGDVIDRAFVIESQDGVEGLRRELKKQGLSDHLEISPKGPMFWAPPDSDYSPKSAPTE